MFQHEGAITSEFINNKCIYIQQVFQALFAHISITEIKSLKMLNLWITHNKFIAATTPLHSNEPPLLKIENMPL